jgi:hypothetical protein
MSSFEELEDFLRIVRERALTGAHSAEDRSGT